MSNIKKFIGEYAYKNIENMMYNKESLCNALVTRKNAKAVFSELSEFEIKSLVSEISNSGTIGAVRKTTQEEIKNTFSENGYDIVIFDDEKSILDCKKYYSNGEVICTYNNLNKRMQKYHMLVAIKENIDEIKRSKNPKRDDEYGTSILNIQIAKNGSHMSIKNRYNHTVGQCDSTFNNDLNNIAMGLQNMVLGYYGYAGITKANNRYNNIVNIGGIYLKYHTERDNIYFGSFVLDGVNGVRYTDSSKYYITEDTQLNYNKFPMVLDFKNKIAIDLIGNNGKIPLVSRAMQEGILHSENKEQAESICAIFTDAKKELLQTNNKALKYISETFGYDFQKPHKIVGMLGKFTANSIKKIIGSSNALLFIADGDRFKIVKLSNGKFEVRDLKNHYSYKIDSFYYQSSFEAKRKSGKTVTYIIQQDKQYYRKIKEKSNVRIYMCINGIRKYFDDMSESEIAQINLKKRLEIYKADKRKQEAQATDYTAEIIKIDSEFITLKTEIISRLTNATTYEEYNTLSKVVNYKLSQLVCDIANFKNSAITKGFISVKQAQNSINNINTVITQLWGYLDKMTI
jgi:hypothetical protein